MVNQYNAKNTLSAEKELFEASTEYTSSEKPIYIERHKLSPRASLHKAVDKATSTENLCQRERLILLIGNGEMTHQIDEYLGELINCVIFNALKTDQPLQLLEIVESVKPDLIIASMSAHDPKGLSLVNEIRSKSINTPIIFFTEGIQGSSAMPLELGEASSLPETLIDVSEMKGKIKAAIELSDIINGYRERQESAQAEKERLSENYRQLKSDVDSRQREYLSHLELLLYSKEVNESLLEKILDLKPYLNAEGKSRLNFIVKKMKWEVNDENQLNIERKLDQSHFNFHKLLGERSAELTKYEKRLCTYFHTNHSSAETARITRRSPNCINVAFSRIRVKLGVKSNQELKILLAALHSSVPDTYVASQK